MKKTVMLAALLGSAAFPVLAAPVDLSSWTSNSAGSANWVLESGNNGVNQTLNGDPTVFFNGVNSQGKKLAGTIEVKTSADNDFIGFVLGYNAGDLNNSAADYLLVDWKQADQTFNGFAPAGLAISRVTGQLDDDRGAWAHDPAFNVTELARATNLGSTGWAENTEYTFDLVFTQSLVEVYVNDVLEISINGSFSDGSFGFYNYSQAFVRYAGIEETIVPPPPPAVPLPASALLLASGLAGLGLLRRRNRA